MTGVSDLQVKLFWKPQRRFGEAFKEKRGKRGICPNFEIFDFYF